MAEIAELKMILSFDPTPEGFDAARELIDSRAHLRADRSSPEEVPPPRLTIEPEASHPPLDDDDIARTIYEAAWEDGLSRPFLKALPPEKEGGLTMAEIGDQLKAYWEDDRPLTPAETRAVYRNVKKLERYYKRRGQIPEDRVLVHKDWDRSEDIGRYYVSAADHAAIAGL